MKFSVAEMMAVSEEAKKVAEEGEAVVLGDAAEGQRVDPRDQAGGLTTVSSGELEHVFSFISLI